MHPTELTFGTWSLSGGGTLIDLIAATTNALNGALLARRPDHYRNYTFVGKLSGRSQEELRMLGLAVDEEPAA